jgi:hypothetical protein
VISANLTLLGVQEGFSQADLRSAYRARVRLVHPDLAVSDSDRVRRTKDTIRLNVAYAELRNASAHKTPPAVVETPGGVVITNRARVSIEVSAVHTFEWSRDSILALLGAIVAGLAASTITGQLPLTVGVMLAGTLGARWAHGQEVAPGRS